MESAVLMKLVWLILSFVGPTTGKFSVVVPHNPVSVRVGSSVFLLCVISPSLNAELFEVRWYRPQMYDTPVLHYKDQQILESSADPQYRGRVSLIGGLDKGNVSLKLDNLTLTDGGSYTCYASSGSWYDTATLSVTIIVVGSVPVLSVTEVGGGQVNVTCVSHGWFPQPTVTWTESEGRDLEHMSTDKFTSDSEGLVSVSSWLLFSLSQSESEWISCSVSLPEWDTRESRILPHEFKQGHTQTPLIITVVLLLLIVTALVIYVFLHHRGAFCQIRSKRKNNRDIDKQQSSEEGTNVQLLKGTEPNTLPVDSDEEDNEQTESAILLHPPVTNPPDQKDDITGVFLDQTTIIKEPRSEAEGTEPNTLNENNEIETEIGVSSLHTADIFIDQTQGTEPNTLPVDSDEEDNGETESAILLHPPVTNPPDRSTNIKEPRSEAEEDEVPDEPPKQLPTLMKLRGTEPNTLPVDSDEEDNGETESAISLHPPVTNPPGLDHVKTFKANITLNADQTPKGLRITLEGKRVTYHQPKGNLSDQKLFSVCKEKFSTGKHYWEVKVWEKPKEKLSWYVGVTRDRDKHHYNVPLTPQNEFWVLCYEEEHGVYFGDIKDQLNEFSDKCTIIGVFLDCDEHTLSFYDVETQSHLHTIENVQSNTSLVSLISPGIRDNKPIKIHEMGSNQYQVCQTPNE